MRARSGRLGDFAGFNATGADLHSLVAALRLTHANGLQIGIKNAGRSIIGVRNIIAKLRAFAANFTTLCHDYFISPVGSRDQTVRIGAEFGNENHNKRVRSGQGTIGLGTRFLVEE